MLQLLDPRQADLTDSFAVCSQLTELQALSRVMSTAAKARHFMGKFLNKRSMGIVRPGNKQVPRLAIEKFANTHQRVKAHALDLALLEQGKVGFGDADVGGQVLGPGLAFGKHHIEFDDDGHARKREKTGKIRRTARSLRPTPRRAPSRRRSATPCRRTAGSAAHCCPGPATVRA